MWDVSEAAPFFTVGLAIVGYGEIVVDFTMQSSLLGLLCCERSSVPRRPQTLVFSISLCLPLTTSFSWALRAPSDWFCGVSVWYIFGMYDLRFLFWNGLPEVSSSSLGGSAARSSFDALARITWTSRGQLWRSYILLFALVFLIALLETRKSDFSSKTILLFLKCASFETQYCV